MRSCDVQLTTFTCISVGDASQENLQNSPKNIFGVEDGHSQPEKDPGAALSCCGQACGPLALS